MFGLMVLSHWLLDFLMHSNLPLFLDGSPLVGLGLENSGTGFPLHDGPGSAPACRRNYSLPQSKKTDRQGDRRKMTGNRQHCLAGCYRAICHGVVCHRHIDAPAKADYGITLTIHKIAPFPAVIALAATIYLLAV